MPTIQPPKGVTHAEHLAIVSGRKGEVTPKHFRLSAEACRILATEAERAELDETKTLELLLREIRELRKRKR